MENPMHDILYLVPLNLAAFKSVDHPRNIKLRVELISAFHKTAGFPLSGLPLLTLPDEHPGQSGTETPILDMNHNDTALRVDFFTQSSDDDSNGFTFGRKSCHFFLDGEGMSELQFRIAFNFENGSVRLQSMSGRDKNSVDGSAVVCESFRVLLHCSKIRCGDGRGAMFEVRFPQRTREQEARYEKSYLNYAKHHQGPNPLYRKTTQHVAKPMGEKYLATAKLGRGGQGDVWLTHHKETGAVFAIKTFDEIEDANQKTCWGG
jgi:hypothetical protein